MCSLNNPWWESPFVDHALLLVIGWLNDLQFSVNNQRNMIFCCWCWCLFLFIFYSILVYHLRLWRASKKILEEKPTQKLHKSIRHPGHSSRLFLKENCWALYLGMGIFICLEWSWMSSDVGSGIPCMNKHLGWCDSKVAFDRHESLTWKVASCRIPNCISC